MALTSSALEPAYWWDAIRSHGAVRTVIRLPGGRGGTEHPRPGQALSDRDAGVAGRVAGRPRGRAVRAPRPQRRRQVDAHPLHHGPRGPQLRLDRGVRPRRRAPRGRRPRRRRPRAAGPQPRLVPHGRGDPRLPRGLLRDVAPRPPRPGHRAARDVLAHREARRAHPDAVGRHEAAAGPRARAHAPPAAAHPRRADRRRGRGAAPGAVALRPAGAQRGDDDPAHDALPGGGRAVLRPDRLHRRRPDRRRGDERGAGGAVRRLRPGGRVPRARGAQGALAGDGHGMTATQIRFLTLVRREVSRFMKIKRQTVGAPLLETFLYISVFGAALGSRISTPHGFDYVVFIIPGLIMMAWAINSFSNNASSILQQKFQRSIDDQLSSPASPLELLLAFSLGGFLRGMLVSLLTFIASSILVGVPVEHPEVLLPGLFFVGFFFSQLGVLVGVRAEQFDDVSFAQTFVLQPLIFLGGVFYSASLLPEPFQTLTHFNPIYYMINLVRYGFLGYTEANVALSLALLTLVTAALFTLNYRLFARGYKLRA